MSTPLLLLLLLLAFDLRMPDCDHHRPVNGTRILSK
jgi:hypothetical protein